MRSDEEDRGRPDVVSLPGVRALPEPVRATVVRQHGVATVADLVRGGVHRARVARRVESGEWRRMHRGVVLLQSGVPTWTQRAWSAVLVAGPGAALSHGSAAYVHGIVRAPGRDVVVSVPAERWVRPHEGVVVRRRRRMPPTIGRLPAVRRESTVVDLVQDAASEDDVVGVLCAAARAGVHPGAVEQEAATRGVLRHRPLLVAVLAEVRAGVESPLERRYDRDVERTHGLPRSTPQVRQRAGGRWIRADRVYVGHGVRVELDGQLAHPFAATDDDVWRDNAVRVEHHDVTLRYRWRHVVGAPCAAAGQVATALAARGWSGTPTRCSAACTVARPLGR
ncbi:type IV toxin-antitoxin system AbiEi family antitoxin domain-containing protein [Cellulomonas sp. 179-A 9B4 NHS]|uniref:type IV toxin-antitoxin system AbiEi family antitoxin domain-containing protein n=1 Tax=Cellulomonas sp. 179-A 9B4 NHS TaxID=3142379 RepID=UPI0039A19198